MTKRDRQAKAYLSETKRTLDGARILFEAREEEGFAQVVKNAYDALEGALSAGIAHRGADIPRTHAGKVSRFFALYDDSLEATVLRWLSKRETAQHVDFEGSELSVPEKRLGKSDAEAILADAGRVVEYVECQVNEPE